MALPTIFRTVLVGANGSIGTLLSRQLANAGLSVGGIDLHPEPSPQGVYAEYLAADATQLPAQARSLVQRADCTILCLPEQEALRAFPTLVEEIAPQTLLVDVLSVKAPIVTLMREARADVELLSIHPMFAPGVSFQEQNVVVVEVTPGPRTGEFIGLLRRWGAHVLAMTAEEHDALTTVTQAATHAAVLAFGMALRKLNYDLEKALAISTPVHRIFLALLARITSADPDVYWKIQRSNPGAAAARRTLTESCLEFQAQVDDGDGEAFSQSLKAIRQLLGPRIESLASYCSTLCAVPTQD
jgi:prephenate dehydrogenase